MAEYKSFSPAAEVDAQAVGAFLAGFPDGTGNAGLQILGKHGLNDLSSGKFYPVQAFLDAMKEVAEKYSEQMLYRIGSEVATHAKLPPEIGSLEEVLQSIDVAYRMNHRGGEIGHYTFRKLAEGGWLHRAEIIAENPYPHWFDLGVVEGFCKRFKPLDCTDIIVRVDELKPSRKSGASSTTYTITWG